MKKEEMMNGDSQNSAHGSEHDASTSMDSDSSQRASVGEELAAKETRVVTLLRLIVIIVLVVAACLVSVGVYLYTSAKERDDFQTQFDGHSTKVIEVFQQNVEKKLGALASFSFTASSYALDKNATWPFVTLPHFEGRTHSVLTQADALSLLIINHIIGETERKVYENYTVANSGWIAESKAYQAELAAEDDEQRMLSEMPDFSPGIADQIWRVNASGVPVVDETPSPWYPLWQNGPLLGETPFENYNTVQNPMWTEAYEVVSTGEATFGLSTDVGDPTDPEDTLHEATRTLIRFWYGDIDLYKGEGVGNIYYPIFENFHKDSKVAGTMIMFLFWRSLFLDILPPTATGIVVIIENTCDQAFTYEINGRDCEFIGQGDFHESKFDSDVRTTDITEYIRSGGAGRYSGVLISEDHCQYGVRVYPSQKMEDEYLTAGPIMFTVGAIVIFLFTSMVFIAYDRFVERRQRFVMRKALQSGAILSSLFPSAIRDQLMEEAENKEKGYMSPNRRIKSFLDGSGDLDAKPIADLFPHTTILFADIAGFTAWSSSREPGQVFLLLQSIYQAFDVVAKKHNVFKVETVGDSYVAVSGLPEPQAKHASVMAKFASECIITLANMTKRLEVKLGPDTGELQMRFGLHSGPVTAGVLRGEKSRFQLFGDTVNMAARMESYGIPSKIQISKATADLLTADGKAGWVKPREELVDIKGKGRTQTYWLETQTEGAKGQTNLWDAEIEGLDDSKEQRLIDWNTEVLLGHLKKVMARRDGLRSERSGSKKTGPKLIDLTIKTEEGKMALDEVREVIELPVFDPKAASREADPESIRVSPEVTSQLRQYVATIASMYKDNPFHNFEHASHVSMAVDKLLKRIVTPELDLSNTNTSTKDKKMADAFNLHDYTHGLTSDPLTHFAIVLSALIHDVDHQGISNMQLGKENQELATKYKNKSIAEQNSVDLAWDLLMAPKFKDLQSCIYSDMEEMKRFRQIVVQVVLATDIFDKELNDLRKNRWNKAFALQKPELPRAIDTNVRATIVIEHIIQASDVSHTMQHWYIYRKWNERLFHEMTNAFKADRMGKDPASFWYKGELGFFDNYVIPLAKKLKDCNVFGVCSDECLNYALQNRHEWEAKGEAIIAEMVEKFNPESKELPESASVDV